MKIMAVLLAVFGSFKDWFIDYSFLIEFELLIEKHIKDSTLSVEKLSKEFFNEYKKHYDAFVDYLIKSNFKRSAFNGDEKAIRDFSRVENLYKDSVATLEQYQNARTGMPIYDRLYCCR